MVNSKSNILSILIGDCNGGFPLVNTIGLPASATLPIGIAVDDFNFDGHLDLAVAARGNGAPVVLIYLGHEDPVSHHADGTFTLSPIVVPSPPDPRAIASADLDGDNRPDIGILSTDSTVTIYQATNTGGFQMLDVFNVRPNATGLSFADLDGNNFKDLALTFSDTNSVQVLFATGPAQFPSADGTASNIVVNPLGKAAARSSLTDGLPIWISLDQRDHRRPRVGGRSGRWRSRPSSPSGPAAGRPVGRHERRHHPGRRRGGAAKGPPAVDSPGNATGGTIPPLRRRDLWRRRRRGLRLCDDNLKNGDGCSKLCAPNRPPHLLARRRRRERRRQAGSWRSPAWAT